MNAVTDHLQDRRLGKVCPWYVAYTFDNWLRGLAHKPERILGEYVKPGMRVADLGCGMGFFSLAMARMVGDVGQVLSVDVQDKMLARVERRAQAAGLDRIIETRLVGAGSLGLAGTLAGPLDFALCFWMLHEVPDPGAFLKEVHELLAPGGCCLVAEPGIHVRRAVFEQECGLAVAAGFEVMALPKVRLSRAVALRRPQG